MKRILIEIISICCLLSGCGVIPQRKITLTLGVITGSNWNVPNNGSTELLDEAIIQFEKDHPNVEIIYQCGIQPDDYKEYISQLILKNNIPDIIFVPSNMFTVLALNHALQPLNKIMEEDDSFILEKYYEKSLNEGKYKNTYYALPYESVPTLMFVNKTLLEKENLQMPSNDWDWNDFYEIASSVTKDTNQDGRIDQFGYYGYTWEDAVLSNQAIIYDEENNHVQLLEENIVEATAFMRKLSSLHDEKISQEMFDKGQVAFCPMNFSDYRTYMPYPWRVKKYTNFEWECISMPKGIHGKNISKIDTLMIAMSSSSKHSDLAWEFMKYLSYNETFQKEMVKHSQGVSVLKDTMKSKEIMDILKMDSPGESNFEMKVLHEIMENGVAIRKTDNYQKLLQSAQASIDNMIQKDTDIENELIQLQRQMNTLLEK